MMSNSIKFPDAHYVGMISNRTGDDLPLAFLTPDGTDSAAQKRRDSVDTWVARNHRHQANHPKAVVMANAAMAGFRLLDDVRRDSSWGSGNVKWRVEDPRGFELEISSPNLMNILASTVVDQGEILDQCMWAREGKENILVPVSSEVYRMAQINTAREEKVASIKDAKRGDAVVQRNGDTGIYMGRMFAIEWDYGSGYNRTPAAPITIKLTPRHVFASQIERNIGSVASPKLSEITPCEIEMSQDDAEAKIAAWIADGWTRNGSSYGALGFTFDKTMPVVTREKVATTWGSVQGHCVFSYGGGLWTPTYMWGSDSFGAYPIEVDAWEEESLISPRGWNHHRAEQSFSKSGLETEGVAVWRVQSRITTARGSEFVISH